MFVADLSPRERVEMKEMSDHRVTIAKDSQQLFTKRPAADKRRLLNFVLSNSSWRDGELTATFRQPFNIIAEMSSDPSDNDDDGGPNLGPRSGWWARQEHPPFSQSPDLFGCCWQGQNKMSHL